MKNKCLIFASFISTMSFFGCEKEEIISETDLPKLAQEFVVTHFPNATITTVIKDKSLLNKDFEVILTNGTSIDFDKKGICTEIDGKTNKLPDSVIPTRILEYVQTNYNSDFIVGWEKENKEQTIQLASKIEIQFDADNNFLRLED